MRVKNQQYFNSVTKILADNKNGRDNLSYKFYKPQQIVGRKTMAEHLRIAVCYWHNFCWSGSDPFGYPTRITPWCGDTPMEESLNKADAIFEFISKLGVPYFTFHDTDIAPYHDNMKYFIRDFYKVVDYIAHNPMFEVYNDIDVRQ